jgi:hypothetical protein
MAGWYDENYKFRAPITLMGGGFGTADFEIDIPKVWDLFWDNIQSTGYDIRVCDSDGVTLLTYDQDGFDYANRVLQIELDNVSVAAASPQPAWLYWGYAAATDGKTAFAPSSPLVGVVTREAPPAAYIVVGSAQPAGATNPATTITKSTLENVYIYWDITDILAKHAAASEGSLAFEGVRYASDYDVLLAGVDQTTMRTAIGTAGASNPLRFLESNGRTYIRTNVTAGADATDYTVSLQFLTVFNKISSTVYDTRTLNVRCLLKVQDVSEV